MCGIWRKIRGNMIYSEMNLNDVMYYYIAQESRHLEVDEALVDLLVTILKAIPRIAHDQCTRGIWYT